MKSSKTVNVASHGSNIARINRILCIYTLLKQFKLSKLIEVEKYQHQETTSIGGSFVAMYITNLGPIEFLFYFLI